MSTLPAFATIDDYTDRFGESADESRTQAALDDASTRIRSTVGDALVNEAGTEIEFPDSAKAWAADTFMAVCCQIAQRRLSNPEGVTAETITGYSYSLTNASADAYVRKGEKADLLAALGRSTAGAWSIDTVGCLVANHSEVCSVNFGAACSCGADIAGYPLYELDP